jgi:hypothetical protein
MSQVPHERQKTSRSQTTSLRAEPPRIASQRVVLPE